MIWEKLCFPGDLGEPDLFDHTLTVVYPSRKKCRQLLYVLLIVRPAGWMLMFAVETSGPSRGRPVRIGLGLTMLCAVDRGCADERLAEGDRTPSPAVTHMVVAVHRSRPAISSIVSPVGWE